MNYEALKHYEPEIQKVAHSRHITENEALEHIFRAGLRTVQSQSFKKQKEAPDWDKFQQLVPGFELFQGLPQGTVEDLSKVSNRNRAGKLRPRA